MEIGQYPELYHTVWNLTTSLITQAHFFLYLCHQGNRSVTATSNGVKLYISDHTGIFLPLSVTKETGHRQLHHIVWNFMTSLITWAYSSIYLYHQGDRSSTATSHSVKLYISDHTGTLLPSSVSPRKQVTDSYIIWRETLHLWSHRHISLRVSVSLRKQASDSYITCCETLHLWSHRHIFFPYLCHQTNRSSTATSHSVKLYISAHTCTLFFLAVCHQGNRSVTTISHSVKLYISDHTGTFSPFICHQGNGSVIAASHGVKLYTSYHTGTFLFGSARVKWKQVG